MQNDTYGDRKHPNLLFVMCDQLSALATSPYGNRSVLTPNLQRMADSGVVFQHNYCNAPLCAPSRASMMTGRLAGSIPVNDNAEELPASVPTFAHVLRHGGYKTVLSGKMHFVGPDQLHGFEERLTTDIYPADFLWTQYWKALGEPPRDPEEALFGRYMAQMVTEAGPVPWSAQMEYDADVHAKALERLRRFARRQEGDPPPWCMCISYTQPHDPYAPTQDYWDRYEGADISMPEDRSAQEDPTGWDLWVNSYHGVDIVRPSRDDVYRTRRAYYAMVSYIDDKLGELFAELERLDFLRDTIVIFTSDHGDMLGEHGMFFKRTFREWSSRVPLVVSGPGVVAGHRVHENVSLVDLLPTLIDLAGLRMPEVEFVDKLSGHTLGPFLHGTIPKDWSNEVIIEHNAEGTIRPTRTLISDRYKYIYTHGAAAKLFDLNVDPDEWSDLARESLHQERVSAMYRRCLTEWNPDDAERQILSSQRCRLFLNEALSLGDYTSWDFQPYVDSSRVHVRRAIKPPSTRASLSQWDPMAGGD